MKLLSSSPLCATLLAVVAVGHENGNSLIGRDVVSSPGDLCAITDTRVAIAEKRLYFMGGRYTFNEGDTDSQEPDLYWLNLNTSFPVEGLISSNFLYSTAAQTNQWVGQGVFFTDPQQTTLYSFGGLPSKPQTNIMSAYNATTESWTNVSVSGGDFNFDTREETLHATTDTGGLGLGFVSGGWDDVPGMVRFNANDTDNLKWTNETTADVPLTLGGTMEYVRYGEKGVLIAFGGYNKDYVDVSLTGWSFDLRSMEIISVYDIANKHWYNVTATGPSGFPADRSEFCTVVSASPDDSSMQITMYAGWGLFAGRAYEDIWVLTLPSFRWIKVDNSGSAILDIADVVGMQGHNCAVYKDRQMIVLGGNVYVGNEKVNGNTCNTSYPSIRVLDTTDYSWQSSFDDQAQDYQVPKVVYNVVGGNAEGGATMKAPKGGFNGTALPSIFSQTVARYTTPTATSTSSSEPGSPSSSSTKSSSSSTGAIAGGVVGGVLGLAIVTGLAFWFLRRRKTKYRRADIPGESDSQVGSDMPMKSTYPAATQSVALHEMSGYRDGEEDGAPHHELDSGYRGQEVEGNRQDTAVELPARKSPR